MKGSFVPKAIIGKHNFSTSYLAAIKAAKEIQIMREELFEEKRKKYMDDLHKAITEEE